MKIEIGEYPKQSDTPRKQEIEIHHYDVWNMDLTLALIIHPMLITFKEQNAAYPCLNLVDECYSRKSVCMCHDAWNDILDKMIWSFKQLIDDTEEKTYYVGEFDKEGWKQFQTRIQEGLDLFGKHYRSLWN